MAGKTWKIRCFSCDTVYSVPAARGERQYQLFDRRPRCPKVRDGLICGALLGGSSSPRDGEDVARSAIFGLAVVTNDIAEGHPRLVREVASLKARLDLLLQGDTERELERLRTTYESPCKGLVPAYDDAGARTGVVPCGRFLGHNGDCDVA